MQGSERGFLAALESAGRSRLNEGSPSLGRCPTEASSVRQLRPRDAGVAQYGTVVLSFTLTMFTVDHHARIT